MIGKKQLRNCRETLEHWHLRLETMAGVPGGLKPAIYEAICVLQRVEMRYEQLLIEGKISKNGGVNGSKNWKKKESAGRDT